MGAVENIKSAAILATAGSGLSRVVVCSEANRSIRFHVVDVSGDDPVVHDPAPSLERGSHVVCYGEVSGDQRFLSECISMCDSSESVILALPWVDPSSILDAGRSTWLPSPNASRRRRLVEAMDPDRHDAEGNMARMMKIGVPVVNELADPVPDMGWWFGKVILSVGVPGNIGVLVHPGFVGDICPWMTANERRASSTVGLWLEPGSDRDSGIRNMIRRWRGTELDGSISIMCGDVYRSLSTFLSFNYALTSDKFAISTNFDNLVYLDKPTMARFRPHGVYR